MKRYGNKNKKGVRWKNKTGNIVLFEEKFPINLSIKLKTGYF